MTQTKKERNDAILKMYKEGKFGYKKIARIFELHYTTVANIITRERDRVGKGKK